MDPILETENQYVKEVLCNTSLKDLPDEKWKLIENFENYAISNYGRVKSLERRTLSYKGKERKQPELIMKLIFVKQFNKYLDRNFYNAQCTLASESQKYRKSLARLVYYHFVEKFDMNDRTILISYKDGNSLYLHSSNLEKISASERRLKTFRDDRSRNRKVYYLKPVSQYTVEGDLLADFESVYHAEQTVGVGRESILDVINKEFLTAAGFRWFLQSDAPKKEDFIVSPKSVSSERRFNKFLWEKLGKPPIDQNNLPGCMDLSLEDIPGEEWKPIPGFEDCFVVSNKGRVKHLSGWTSKGKKIFLQDRILSQIVPVNKGRAYSLYSVLNHKGKNTCVTITRLLYSCFVEEFDIYSKRLVVVNQNESQWDMDISKLSLHPIHSVLKGKVKIEKDKS
ncbi:MAG: NUMOD4 domain-containing protein [Flavobacterium sp.]|nr:NUMOD4 domain-containing protein [Flavobacterium sp.]